MGYSLGVGLTNDCDLQCPHCYRAADRDSLSFKDLVKCINALPVDSVNLGTGENGLHPRYLEILGYLFNRGIKVSITSNGYSIDNTPDEMLRLLSEVELSLDFPTEAEQDSFRGAGNWKKAWRAIARCKRLGLEVTVLAVMMKANYRALALLARLSGQAGANLRVNVYQPVRVGKFSLSYDEFWDGFKALFSETSLIACNEPVVMAAAAVSAGLPPSCGRSTLRITPSGTVLPCVYWPRHFLSIDDLASKGALIFQHSEFNNFRTIPEECQGCAARESCAGGCSGRRALTLGHERRDIYCPFSNGRTIELRPSIGRAKNLLKASSACTTVVSAV